MINATLLNLWLKLNKQSSIIFSKNTNPAIMNSSCAEQSEFTRLKCFHIYIAVSVNAQNMYTLLPKGQRIADERCCLVISEPEQ